MSARSELRAHSSHRLAARSPAHPTVPMRSLAVLLMAATAGLALGATPHPLLRRLNRAREFSVTDRIDPSCPFVPKPVALPNPLPAALETALGQLGSVLDSLVDPVACPGYAAALSYQVRAPRPFREPGQRRGPAVNVLASLWLHRSFAGGMCRARC